MKHYSPVGVILAAAIFLAGFTFHVLYQRWRTSSQEPPSYSVAYAPPPPLPAKASDMPLLDARDVEKIRKLAGTPARVRGRIFRVGHAEKSNTYFLNFGPSRASFTGVIFASSVELFEKSKLPPKSLEGKEIELQGEIKDHPQHGLEMIVEHPSQLKVLD